jgi:hypothetical protein
MPITPVAGLLTASEAARCAVVVEQKGDDPVEYRERVMAGLVLHRAIARGRSCDFVVVGGAGGDAPPEVIREWCAGSDAEPVICHESRNTRDKAESIARFAAERRTTAVIQVTALYHSLRAYLTTVAALRDNGAAVPVLNYVSDADDVASIHACVLDEIFLAKELDGRLGFGLEPDAYGTYVQALREMRPTAGHRTYLARRHGEARRLVAYAEIGKGHLVTDLPTKEILNSYLPWTIGAKQPCHLDVSADRPAW